MAIRDDQWPGYTQWYCCDHCRRLWTFQGDEMVVLDTQLALAAASATPGVPGRRCPACIGMESVDITSI